jgi:hypothetical protein
MLVGGSLRQSTRIGTGSPLRGAAPSRAAISTQGLPPQPTPSSASNLLQGIPQGIVYALQALTQLESEVGQAFDERMKALSNVGQAIAAAAKGLKDAASQAAGQGLTLAGQGLSTAEQTVGQGLSLAGQGISNAVFSLPVSEDNAPLEGATYRVGKRVFAKEKYSLVSAILRIQWTVSIDPVKVLGLPSGLGDGASVKMMVPGGFIYLLADDTQGFIEEIPVVPKVEVGAGLELGEGSKGAAISPVVEIKAETEFESTFFWLKIPGLGGYKTLATIVNLFNQAMTTVTDNAVTLGLQACERNKGPVVDPSAGGSLSMPPLR